MLHMKTKTYKESEKMQSIPTMSLDKFCDTMVAKVERFRSYWTDSATTDPANWPQANTEGEWDEQFIAYLTSSD